MKNEKTIFADFDPKTEERLNHYLLDTFAPEDSILSEIRERALKKKLPAIQVGKLDGLHLEVLARLSGAKLALEIGTLAGYSGVSLLRGMGPGSKLFTIEGAKEHVEVAQESFEKAGLSSQVQILHGNALKVLSAWTPPGPLDLVFIDANKEDYPQYLEFAHKHLKMGGLVIGDNTLAWGMLTDEEFTDEEDRIAVLGIREFNHQMAKSGRFRSTLLPTGEGLTVGIKVR